MFPNVVNDSFSHLIFDVIQNLIALRLSNIVWTCLLQTSFTLNQIRQEYCYNGIQDRILMHSLD